MEEKINQEIRSYTEAVFFGLSLRQLFCAGAFSSLLCYTEITKQKGGASSCYPIS